MSDLDLSKLLGGGSTKPKEEKPSASQAPRPTTSPGDQARRKMDGQITEYTEATGEGIEDVEAMLKIDPENMDLTDWLAFLYYTNNRLDDAIEMYRRLLSNGHKPESQYFYLGNAYFKKGLSQLAIEQWKRCVETDPTSSVARKAQARIEEATA